MKRNYLLIFFAALSAHSFGQLNIQSGATFVVQNGATVTVQGDITSNADIQGNGTILLKGSSLQTVNMNGFSIQNLQVDNANNIALGGNVTIGTSVLFTSGKIQLNTYDFTLSSTSTLTGYDATKYLVTNNTGRVIRTSLGNTAFTFPVGFDLSSYNPLTLTQNGTVDNIGVRCLSNVLKNGGSGAPFVKEVVDASWAVTEGTAGGNNLTMTSGWSGTDELTGFNRAKTGISYYDGVGWDMTNAQTGASSGAGPYTVTRSNITSLANGGYFAVGTRPVMTQLLVSPKALLQGAVNGSTGTMTDLLRSGGLLPLTDPYTGLAGFTHSGSGGGETIPSTVLTATGTNSDITDWVFLSLHDGTTGTVLSTHAVLIQKDGNIVDVDGTNTKTNYINFAGFPAGSYFVSVRHRNHLGVRSASNLALSRTVTTSLDFTSSLSSAFAGSVTNNAMATLGGGFFGLWGGDINRNKNVKFNGPGNDLNELLNTCLSGNKTISLNGYSPCDLNLDRVTKFNGPGNDLNVLLNTILGGDKTRIINQPNF